MSYCLNKQMSIHYDVSEQVTEHMEGHQFGYNNTMATVTYINNANGFFPVKIVPDNGNGNYELREYNNYHEGTCFRTFFDVNDNFLEEIKD